MIKSLVIIYFLLLSTEEPKQNYSYVRHTYIDMEISVSAHNGEKENWRYVPNNGLYKIAKHIDNFKIGLPIQDVDSSFYLAF